jgi:hypothetical protein
VLGTLSFYDKLNPKLSQGDILRDVPWGQVESPITICRPDQPKQADGKAHYGTPENMTPAAYRKDIPEFLHLKTLRNRAIVLWHDCQLDKFDEKNKPRAKWFTTVSPIFGFDDLDEPARQVVREGGRRAFFYMPANPDSGIETECYVDLRYALSFRYSLLESRRLTTLSKEARQSLYLQFFTFLTALRLANAVDCPACKAHITVSQFFNPEDVE